MTWNVYQNGWDRIGNHSMLSKQSYYFFDQKIRLYHSISP